MELPLDRYWTAFGRIVAVFSGALIVLLGLLADVPLGPACGRGLIGFVAIRVLTRVGATAIAWTDGRTYTEADAEPAQSEGQA